MAGDRHAMSPGGPGAATILPDASQVEVRRGRPPVHRRSGRPPTRGRGSSILAGMATLPRTPAGTGPRIDARCRASDRPQARRWVRRAAALLAFCCWGLLSTSTAAAGGVAPVDSPAGDVSGTRPAPAGTWRLPAAGEVAALFVAPSIRWGPGHRGIDIAARVGARVVAPRPGVVVFVGTVVDRGVVTLRHAGGLRTSLEPVSATVVVGQSVTAGEEIGVVSPDRAHCPGCLHWGVRAGTDYVDPLSLLAREPVVLLPAGISPGRPPGGTCAAGASPRCASGRSATP